MTEIYHLNIFKCKLCEESIFAEHKSSTCPFCGAHDYHIILAKDWIIDNSAKIISEESRKYLEESLELEKENMRFYKCSMSHTNNKKLKTIFSGLFKIETEHMLLLSKILKIQKQNINIRDICFVLDDENIKTAIKKTKEAITFYTNLSQKIPEQKIKNIYSSFIEIKKDHIKLLEDIF